jgi:trypsin
LQAAHCVDGANAVFVYAGLTDRNNVTAAWKATVSKENFTIHEKYNADMISNDIALLRIPAMQFDSLKKPIDLANNTESDENIVGKMTTIIGWGKTSDFSTGASKLQYTQAPIVSNSVCRVVFGRTFVLPSNICLDTKLGKSACNGYEVY